MPELREVFEMVTKQTEPHVDAWREQEQRQRRASRNKKLAALAVAAAIGAAAIVVILEARRGQDTTTPAEQPPSVSPAVAVATGFLVAYSAFDVDRAITYLADDAFISELTTSVGAAEGVEGLPEELRLHSSLLQAVGYEQMLDSCEEMGSSTSGTRVRCTFDFHFLRSDQIGLGPFSGSYFDLTVRDGEIARASVFWETEELSPQMWEPFAAWVSATYPEDAAVMYDDETYTRARLTEESIRLWERHSRGYATELTGSGRTWRAVEGVRFSLQVPPRDALVGGWERFGRISINKSESGPQGAEGMIFWTSFPDGQYADPCANLLSPAVGPSAAHLSAAVATAPGTELVAEPSDVTVGGRAAKHVVLTVRESVGCDPGFFYTWQDLKGGALFPRTTAGDTIRVWIIEVDGTRLFIEAVTTEEASLDLEQEIQQIIDSIRFD